MSTLSNILEQGRRALQVQQMAMQVIGHNTSNAGTVGFSRRRLDLSTAAPYGQGMLGLGSGVDVDRLARVRDQLLDTQIRGGLTTQSYWSTSEDQLARIEETFNALGDVNLSNSLDQFWQGWHDLANEPESMAARYSLQEKSQALIGGLKRTYGELEGQLAEVNTRITETTGSINELTASIAELNVRISNAEVNGQEASDLRDSRDLAVDQLASLIDINVHEQADGTINVYVGGDILVQRDLQIEINVDRISTDPRNNVSLTLGSNLASWRPTGGQLGALMDHRDTQLTEVMDRLDAFAVEFSDAVNARHVTGYGLNGQSGVEFFANDVSGVETLALNTTIIGDPSAIAAASTPGAPGDNSMATAIAAMRDQKLSSGGTLTLDQLLQNISLDFGARRASAKSQNEIETAVVENLENRRLSVSGVSLDEEMAKLLESQKAYEAAAKIIQTIDEMMTTVINMKQ
jgi:flagellar hook-associated protein 1 FlgK